MTEMQRLIQELQEASFECDGGYLKDFIPFKDLKRLIDEQAKRPAMVGQHTLINWSRIKADDDLKGKKKISKAQRYQYENGLLVGFMEGYQEGRIQNDNIRPVVPALTRPICFLDLETTGTDPDKDFIVEISVVKVNVDYTEEVKTLQINPGIPIPLNATAIHGITNEMVQDKPTFAAISKSLLMFIDGCDIAGFNSNRFDVPLLFSMFNRVGLQWDWRKVNLIDVRNIFVQKEERTLSAAVRFYLKKDHSTAHSAEGDIQETKLIFYAMLGKYDDLPKDMKSLALYSNYGRPIIDMAGKFEYNEANQVVFTFGPHKGQVATTEKGFLNWMLGKDFTNDTKEVVKQLLLT